MSTELKEKILSISTKIKLVEDSIKIVKKLDLDEASIKDMIKDYNVELKFLKKELKEYQSLTKEKHEITRDATY